LKLLVDVRCNSNNVVVIVAFVVAAAAVATGIFDTEFSLNCVQHGRPKSCVAEEERNAFGSVHVKCAEYIAFEDAILHLLDDCGNLFLCVCIFISHMVLSLKPPYAVISNESDHL